MLKSFQEVDIRILNFIDSYFRFPLLDRIMTIITSLGNCGIAWIFLSIYLICNNYRMEGYMVIVSMILTAIVGEGIIKHITRRSRPVLKINQGTLLITKPMTYSFPSGHAASSFSVAGVFIMQNSNISIYITILASLIAFSRLYLSVHYPSDVLTGVILGLLCSIIVCDVINNIFVVY